MKPPLFKNKDCILATLLYLMIPIWIGLTQEWYTWYNQDNNALYTKWLYTLINNRWLINIPISIILIYIYYCWYERIYRDHNFRSFRFPLALLGLIILNYDSQVVYANIIYSFSYRVLMTILSGLATLLILFKDIKNLVSYYKQKKINKTNDQATGFSTDNNVKGRIPYNLTSYASTIADRLIATNNKSHSYAVGIIGEWGCGKSTFLDLLKEQLEGKAEIIEFNPWMCRTPEQVTYDFFAALRHQLSSKYSSLSKPIKKYARYINSQTITPNNMLGFNLSFSPQHESLYEKKQELSNKVSRLSRPIIVFIDDIDRLEREEVFEVLRLIRNTADLSNTIYIVAYDKEYVTSVLEEKNIKDASSYLEKIFQVEVHLPKVNDYLIWEALKEDIKEQDNINNRFTEQLFKHLSNSEYTLILKILNNYRRAKRFARIFMLNIKYLSNQYKGEIKILDLFWLELLQMYDKLTYDRLSYDPYILLYSEDERFKIRPGIHRKATEKEKNAYKGEKFWKEETPNILGMIFGNYINTKKSSICYTENYDKYFALSVSPYKLSFKETKELFNQAESVEETITQWINNGKYFNSIIYQLKQISPNNLNNENLKVLTESILCFGIKSMAYRINLVGETKKMLRKERYNTNKAHNIALSYLDSVIDKGENLFHTSKFLKELYTTEVYDQEGDIETQYPLIISKKEIEEYLCKSMKRNLCIHSEFTALDVMNEDSELFRFFGNCCVLTVDSMLYDNCCSYSQVAFDTIIVHFSQKEIKPSMAQYHEAYNTLFNTNTPNFTTAEEENDWWAYYNEFAEHQLEEHFGSSYTDKLEEFRTKCFCCQQN